METQQLQLDIVFSKENNEPEQLNEFDNDDNVKFTEEELLYLQYVISDYMIS